MATRTLILTLPSKELFTHTHAHTHKLKTVKTVCSRFPFNYMRSILRQFYCITDFTSAVHFKSFFCPNRRIMKKDPPFPKDMGPLAKDIIQRLLIKDPKKRLGSGPSGAQNVKSHPFYQVREKLIIFKVKIAQSHLSRAYFLFIFSLCQSLFNYIKL